MTWPRKRPSEINTLTLIGAWSMDGAESDLGGGFASPVDIHAHVAERSEEPTANVPPPEPGPLLMKPAGEDDWRPLLLEVSDAA